MNRATSSSLRRQSRRARQRTRFLRVEPLEQRNLLATFVVDITHDENDGNTSAGDLSLREAVISAIALAGNDTIVLPAGTFALTLTTPPTTSDGAANGDLDVINGHIIFQGAGREQTIIDASALGDRILETHGTGGVSLSDLTLRGGTAGALSPAGGALLNRGRSTINNVNLTSNHAVHLGGGVYNDTSAATLTVSNSTFSDNEASGGGAIGNNAGAVSIFSSSFIGNRSVLDGGAVWTGSGSFAVQDSLFADNSSAPNVGGGAISARTFNMRIERTTFQGNEAGFGGAIIANDKIIVRSSTLVGNVAQEDGGGIYLPAAAVNQPHEIVNNTFSGNIAGEGGGAYVGAWSTFVNNTITANRGLAGVGGIDNRFGHSGTRFQNNLIAGNFGTTTSGDAIGTFISNGGNLVGNGTGVGGFSQPDDQRGLTAPINPRLGPLASNGGPTQTHALLSGSPAIDRGRNTAAAPTTDQRGLPRPVGGGVDIGAFEVQGNSAPVAADNGYATDEDTILNVAAPGVLGNDSDADGSPLTATLVSGPTNGTLTLNSNGSFAYRPRFNFNGTDSFTYRARDGAADSNVATVTFTVAAVNDAPRPTPIVTRVTTDEDTAINGQLSAVDAENDPFTFTSPPEFAPTHGTVTVNADGTWTYTPAPNYHGNDFFGYRVTDNQGASEVGVVDITVASVNDAPLAVADAYAVAEDGSLLIGVAPISRLHMVSERGDFIGQGLTWDFIATTALFGARTNFDNGVEVVVDPPGAVERWSLNFAAPGNAPLAPVVYLGATRFPFQTATEPGLDVSGYGRGLNRLKGSFVVHDVAYGAAAGTVTRFAASFIQQGHNFDDTLEPPLHGTITFNSTFGAAGGVLENDSDVEGDMLPAAALVSGPANGTLTWNGDGTFAYVPNPNFHGTDTFTYRASDGQADSNVATVTITVNPVNDAPVAVDDSADTDEDTAVTIDVRSNDSDLDGDTLTPVLVGGPANGALVPNANGTFTYTPGANFHGTDTFTYLTNDGTDDSNVATVTITVNPVNDLPVANSGSLATNEDTAGSGQLAAADIDGDSLTYSVVVGPAHGGVVVNADGTFTYTPAANYNGPDSFTFWAYDGTVDSNVATVTITVNPVNDVPVAQNDSLATNEDTTASGQLVATDIDGDSLTYSVVAGPAYGTLDLNAATGAFSYTPAANFRGSDGFTFRASDGGGDSSAATFAIAVTPANDAPTAVDDFFTALEDTPLALVLPGVLDNDADVDGDALTALLASGPSHGTLALNPDGSLTYAPAANFHGTDTFTYRASDGTAQSAPAVVTIEVTPLPDAPVALADSYSTPHETPLVVAAPGLLANDTDADGDSLTAAVVTGPANGTLTLNPNGSFTYVPAAGFTGSDSFTYRASDGAANSAPVVVSLSVTAAPTESTAGKINGIGALDRGLRSFFINVHAQESRHGLRLHGQFRFLDLQNRIYLESTELTQVRVEEDGNLASLRGTAKLNGRAGYTFVVTVEAGSKGRDRFRVQILGPDGYSYDSLDYALREGLLDFGHINVRKK
ncbi:MAG: Ig-like domain-containing protein [Pirellulaceae bacterium]